MSAPDTISRVRTSVRDRALALVVIVGLAIVAAAWALGTPTPGPRLAATGAVVSIGIIVVAVGLVVAGGVLGLIAYRRRKSSPTS